MQRSQNIEPLHGVTCRDKFAELVQSMEANGWVGRPIVARADEDGNLIGITGSHRVAAARRVGISVPYVWVDDGLYLAAAEKKVGGVNRLCDEDRLAILEEMGEVEAADIFRQS